MQVCKRWRAVAARNLQMLRPAMLKMHVFVRVFPSLTVLDLSGALRCASVCFTRLCLACLAVFADPLFKSKILTHHFHSQAASRSAMIAWLCWQRAPCDCASSWSAQTPPLQSPNPASPT